MSLALNSVVSPAAGAGIGPPQGSGKVPFTLVSSRLSAGLLESMMNPQPSFDEGLSSMDSASSRPLAKAPMFEFSLE